MDANELIHQADLAVYRAKLQGRNRVLGASTEPLLLAAERGAKLRAVREDGEHVTPLPAAEQLSPLEERRHPRPHALHGPTFFALSPRLGVVVGVVSLLGFAAGIAGLLFLWKSATTDVSQRGAPPPTDAFLREPTWKKPSAVEHAARPPAATFLRVVDARF